MTRLYNYLREVKWLAVFAVVLVLFAVALAIISGSIYALVFAVTAAAFVCLGLALSS